MFYVLGAIVHCHSNVFVQLTGLIPLSGLPSLQYLCLAHNRIEMSARSFGTLGQCAKLVVCDLSYNNIALRESEIDDAVQDNLQNLRKLQVLDLRGNKDMSAMRQRLIGAFAPPDPSMGMSWRFRVRAAVLCWCWYVLLCCAQRCAVLCCCPFVAHAFRFVYGLKSIVAFHFR